MRKDQWCYASVAEFKSQGRHGSQSSHLSYSDQSQSGSKNRLTILNGCKFTLAEVVFFPFDLCSG